MPRVAFYVQTKVVGGYNLIGGYDSGVDYTPSSELISGDCLFPDQNGTDYAYYYKYVGYTKSGWYNNNLQQSNPETGNCNFVLGTTFNQGQTATGTSWYNDVYFYYFNTLQGDGISYTMSYDKGAEGATGSVSNTTITYGSTPTIAANSFALTGRTFANWHVYKGNVYVGPYNSSASLGTWDRTGNHTAYAQWSANTFTIAHNANATNPGATGTTGNTTSTYNTKAKANTNGFSRSGYFFAGWITTADGTGTDRTVYQADSEFNHPGTISTLTLYAVWTGWLYTLSYDGNGNTGTATTAATTARYPTAVSVASNGFGKTGYTFINWTSTAIATATGSVTYAGDGTATIANPVGTADSSKTLYAQWTVNSYTITYSGNNNTGTATTDATTATYDSTFTFPANGFTRIGYTFNKWKLMNGTTEVGDYSASGSYGTWDIASNCTAVAQWTINTYVITFDKNGKGIGKSVTQDYNSTVTCPTLKAVGYVFGGWATSVQNATNKILDKAGGAQFTLGAAAENYFAIWTDNANNTVRFSELQTVFGGSYPISISEYRTQSEQTTANSRITVSTHFKGKGVAPP